MTDAPAFSFRVLSNKTFPSFEAISTKELLHKWGLLERTSIQAFSYDNYFQVYQKEQFILSFFKDPCIQENFKVITPPSHWTSVGDLCAKSVDVNLIPATITNMGFFDKIYHKGLVRENGSICKCYDEQIDDILVSDEVRKMLLSDESDFESLFSEKEKSEFIFRLFRHLCIGGPVCQFEDDIKPYLDTVKFLYKDLISVYRNSETKEITVNSIVLQAVVKDSSRFIFPGSSHHTQNIGYFIVDPLKRHVITLYHSWDGFR